MRLKPWIIFDADNTLWPIEYLYDEARQALCDFIAAKGFPIADVEAFQQRRDKDLHATYGYSACRFARSFEDTLLNYVPSFAASDVRHVRRLALDVFEREAVTAPSLDEVINTLAANYLLGIITAGERWVQERRLNNFHLRGSFTAIEIVESKSASVFTAFCNKHGVDRAKSWVVGDSLNSDVIPAREAGLMPIWLRAKNWSHVEGSDGSLEDVVSIDDLIQLSTLPQLQQV